MPFKHPWYLVLPRAPPVAKRDKYFRKGSAEPTAMSGQSALLGQRSGSLHPLFRCLPRDHAFGRLMLDEMRVEGCFYCRLSLSSSPGAFATLILSRLTQDILYPVLLCIRPLLSCLLGWEGSQVLLEYKLETKVGKKLLSQTTLRI